MHGGAIADAVQICKLQMRRSRVRTPRCCVSEVDVPVSLLFYDQAQRGGTCRCCCRGYVYRQVLEEKIGIADDTGRFCGLRTYYDQSSVVDILTNSHPAVPMRHLHHPHPLLLSDILRQPLPDVERG